MRDRPDITDESVMMKWMALEFGRMNKGIVTSRRTLAELLAEVAPTAATKGGGEHRFDRRVLAALGEKLPPEMHRRLRLPILFRQDMTVASGVYLTDEAAVTALQMLGELGPLYRMEKERLWISRPIAYAILLKYPTAVQMMIL